MDVDDKPAGSGIRQKGRGFKSGDDDRAAALGSGNASFDRVDDDKATGVASRSVEGWIVFVSGVHEEATEEDVTDVFAEYGEIKNLHLNLDRRTGYVKGYALVEYEMRGEAEKAIKGTNNTKLLDQTITCDFAFVKKDNASNGPSGGAGRTGRPLSPTRRNLN